MCKTKVFYKDKSHTLGDCLLETRGVQAIVQDSREVGAEIVTGSDYYILEDGRWRGVDIFGLYDFLMDSGLVLFGRTLRREEYNVVMKEVLEEKAGWLPHERKP